MKYNSPKSTKKMPEKKMKSDGMKESKAPKTDQKKKGSLKKMKRC